MENDRNTRLTIIRFEFVLQLILILLFKLFYYSDEHTLYVYLFFLAQIIL